MFQLQWLYIVALTAMLAPTVNAAQLEWSHETFHPEAVQFAQDGDLRVVGLHDLLRIPADGGLPSLHGRFVSMSADDSRQLPFFLHAAPVRSADGTKSLLQICPHVTLGDPCDLGRGARVIFDWRDGSAVEVPVLRDYRVLDGVIIPTANLLVVAASDTAEFSSRGDWIVGVDTETGDLLWQHREMIHVDTPVLIDLGQSHALLYGRLEQGYTILGREGIVETRTTQLGTFHAAWDEANRRLAALETMTSGRHRLAIYDESLNLVDERPLTSSYTRTAFAHDGQLLAIINGSRLQVYGFVLGAVAYDHELHVEGFDAYGGVLRGGPNEPTFMIGTHGETIWYDAEAREETGRVNLTLVAGRDDVHPDTGRLGRVMQDAVAAYSVQGGNSQVPLPETMEWCVGASDVGPEPGARQVPPQTVPGAKVVAERLWEDEMYPEGLPENVSIRLTFPSVSMGTGSVLLDREGAKATSSGSEWVRVHVYQNGSATSDLCMLSWQRFDDAGLPIAPWAGILAVFVAVRARRPRK